MNKFVALACLVTLVSCGKKAGNDSKTSIKSTPELQTIETQRVNDISTMTSDEVSKQSEFPLTTKEGTITFLNAISTKLENGSKVSDLSAHIWLLLESVHLNWLAEDKTTIKNKLETLASFNEEISEMIDLFFVSEGLKSNNDKNFDNTETTDINHKSILVRKNVLMAKSLLSTDIGLSYWVPSPNEETAISKASQELIYLNLKDQSLGQPIDLIDLDSSWNLPYINWSGSIYSDWAGTKGISGQQVNGVRFGGTKDWSGAGSDGHAFITPNMSSQIRADNIDYNLSLVTEIKGGTKKRSNGGTRDKSSTASFDLTGKVIVPQCVDLNKCSPFAILRVNNFQLVSNATAQIKINGSVFNLKEEQLINRTEGPTEIEISTSARRSHSGKSGAIHDTLTIGLSLIQDTDIQAGPLNIESLISKQPSSFIKVNKWAKMFEEGLVKGLSSDNSGTYIFRHIKYLDEISKRPDLDVNQLSAIKVLYRFIIQESMIRYSPIVHKLINEKRRNILRLPTTEIAAILNESMQTGPTSEKVRSNYENLKRSLSKVDDKKLKEIYITDEQLELAAKKSYLMVTLYKNLNDKITAIALELEKDIQQLEAELAQLQHMTLRPEETDAYEIH